MHKQPQQDDFFIKAAMISGKLTSVIETAKQLSLAAKNARAIAMRAGTQARGFKPITDFINDMGMNTQELVGAINKESLDMSRSASSLLQLQQAHARYLLVLEKIPDSGREKVKSIIHETEHDIKELTDKVNNHLYKLRNEIDEIIKSIKAAGIISTTSRIEAINSNEYRSGLETVASTVDEAAKHISAIVNECRHALMAN